MNSCIALHLELVLVRFLVFLFSLSRHSIERSPLALAFCTWSCLVLAYCGLRDG